ncbi:hypothetical protein RND81_05G115400 [Saponaria officinalis]|uniref:non-specific serine/threonine protein kinase n=1 Tax=Saponaria officinalis TaxID=3572 RepID=A0AAW1KXF8_SAPOF
MKLLPHYNNLCKLLALILILTMGMLQSTSTRAKQSLDFRGNETDHISLLAIKNRVKERSHGILSSWNDSTHHCYWGGVTCGRRHNRVIALELYSSGLIGAISPYIGNLSFLKVISLYNNSLQGKIPPELGRLHRLQVLKLENNTLVGEIPANLSACIELKILKLGCNKLVGELPLGLGVLSNLREFHLHFNNFTGPLFEVLANITTLEVISAWSNAFTGTIPDNIDRMTNLTWLGVGGNQLDGVLPPSISNLSSLVLFEVTGNYFKGSLPPFTGVKFPQLQILNLDANYFSGTLPLSASNFTSLEEVILGDNLFTGTVSLDFSNNQNLQLLDLSYNNLQGDMSFVSSLTNCSNLGELVLNVNNFTGSIPKSIVNLSSILTDLWIGGNKIRGVFPEGLGNLVNLEYLDVGDNDLTGKFPIDFGNLQYLGLMNFSSNALTGSIPDIYGNLTRLSKVDLGGNKLEGIIPPSLGRCQYLLYLNLSHNLLDGTLPKELLGGSAKFVELDLHQNTLQGSIPLEISMQINLVNFDVSENKLSGELPSGLGDCSALQFLNLERNFFDGSIPSSFTSLGSLDSLDLSYNKLEGRVPSKGAFANASVISLIGNSGLCGGIPELHLPRCAEEAGTQRKRHMSRAIKLIILIVCTVVGALILSLWFYLTCARKKKKLDSSAQVIMRGTFSKVSYSMLLKATDGFSAEKLLGKGSFGSVFEGILNGKPVAIKVLNSQNRGASKSFMAECKALKNIRHRNLVGIITACSSIDFRGNEFRALVYEFMPNGSVDKWIYKEVKLSLLQRVDIGLNVAHAINYLHHESQTPIVHCDLKPSNILLDQDMVAHVGDFGLAKFLARPPHPNQSSSIAIRGTVGYAAPEYGLGSEASTEGDIYSYGILLLELMTGKRPTDDMFQADFNLHMYAKAALPDQVLQIVDPALENDDITEEVDNRRIQDTTEPRVECMASVVSVGVACSNDLPQDRMKITDAISRLQAARDNLLNAERRRQFYN